MTGVFINPTTTGSIVIADLPEINWPVFSWTREGANAAFNTWEAVENQSVTTITSPSPWDPARANTVGMSGGGYRGLILGNDDKLYSPPWEEDSNILVIDPVANTAIGVSFGVTQARYGLVYNGQNYLTGALAPNGKIYCPPFNIGAGILVLDPATQTSYAIPQTYNQQHYGTAVLGANGKIYCMGRQDCLIINPANDTIETTNFGGVVPVYNTAVGTDETGRWTASVRCLADDKLYFVSRTANYLVVVNTITGTAERRTFNSTAIANGQTYNGIANYQDGKLVLTPYGTTTFGSRNWTVIDPLANSAVDINISAISSGVESFGAISGDDAGIYSYPRTPAGGTDNLDFIYTRNGTTVVRSKFDLSLPGIGPDPEWFGGCLAPNGKIYVLPDMQYHGPSDPLYSSLLRKSILVLEPGGNAIQSIGAQNFRTLIDTSYFNKGGT